VGLLRLDASDAFMLAFIASIIVLAFIIASLPTDTMKGTGYTVTIYQTPWCSCCRLYADYLEASGIGVNVVVVDDLSRVKQELGVPRQLWSCHTGVVEGYVVEGHVPVEAIRKLLEERPDVDGLAVPGMPPGAPGMGGEPERLTVYWFKDGRVGVYLVVESR
jgi:hypothetical protein